MHSPTRPFIPLTELHVLTLRLFLIECDKSFTRSDALAKHMRLQHNVEASAPGRGGNRKRKRDREEPSRPTVSTASDPAGFSIFKVEPHTPSEMHIPSEAGGTPAADDYFNGGRSPSPVDEGIPSYLTQDLDPATGLIRGRAPDMVKYLVMKAKFSFALEQHSTLLEELRVLRAEECALRQGKDEALDTVMRMEFGWVPRHFYSLVCRGLTYLAWTCPDRWLTSCYQLPVIHLHRLGPTPQMVTRRRKRIYEIPI
jgi:hypothetical protein